MASLDSTVSPVRGVPQNIAPINVQDTLKDIYGQYDQAREISGVIPEYQGVNVNPVTGDQYNPNQQPQQGQSTGNMVLSALTQDPTQMVQSDITSNLAGFGRALGYNPNAVSVGNRGAARAGKTLSLIGHAGSALLQGARTVLGGMAAQKQYQESLDYAINQYRNTEENKVIYAEDGAIVPEGKLVEVEKGEFIQTPQGTIAEVQGKTHEQGGENMILPVGSEITSDNKKLGKKGVDTITEQLGDFKIKLLPTDTYADAMRKFDRKLDLATVDSDITQTEDQIDNLSSLDDDSTYSLNYSYLTDKLTELNEERALREQSRSGFLDFIFDLQQSGRKGESNAQQFFKNGGEVTDNQIYIIAKKHNLPASYVKEMLHRQRSKATITKMEDGGRIWEPEFNPYRVQSDQSGAYGHQGFTNIPSAIRTSGQVDSASFTNRINTTLGYFPVAESFYNIDRDDDDNIINITPKGDDSISKMQQYQQTTYDNLRNAAVQGYFGDLGGFEGVRDFTNYLDTINYSNDPSNVRGIDNILGDFTSSRSGVSLRMVTPEELKTIQDAGISRFTQLFDNGQLKDLNLSDDTKNRLQKIYEGYGNNIEFGLLDIPSQPQQTATPPADSPQVQVTPENPATPPKETGNPGATDVKPFQGGSQKRPFQLPFLPNQRRNDWDTMDAHLMQTPRYDRLESVNVDPSSTVQAIRDNFATAANSLNNNPSPQNISALSSMLATTDAASRQAILEAETRNALNDQQVAQYNAQAHDKEEDARLRERRIFEKLQLTAKAYTDQNNDTIRRHNQRVQMTNFQTVQNMRNIHNLSSNYGIDRFGGIQVDRTTGNPIQQPTSQGGGSQIADNTVFTDANGNTYMYQNGTAVPINSQQATKLATEKIKSASITKNVGQSRKR